jgi:hypothetical protein
VALQLAEDRRYGVGGEGDPPREVETVDRLQQAERGDLQQVVERLLRAVITARELTCQRHEPLHELLPRPPIAIDEVALEERCVVAVAIRRRRVGKSLHA